MRRFGDGRDWFFGQRFGMFVHWGLYAIPAWHEQLLWRGRMRRSEYEKLREQFNPGAFDPDAWLDVLEATGMEYLCFTTKHHDGFCMWDTAFTDYSVMHAPYGKDVLASLAEACHRRDVKLGLYYSLPDWHHPSYPNQGRHHEMFGPRAGDEPDEAAYLTFVRNQVEELLTNYGPVHAFFWDVNVAEFADPSLNELVRRLAPNALINDRGPGPGDYTTPERQVPEGKAFERPTEACQSVGRESWGYRADEDYYSSKRLMSSIDKIMAMGGNYLLNVGPTADGELPQTAVTKLARIGDWYTRVRESFNGTVPCSHMLTGGEIGLARYDNVLLTRRRNTIYVHCPEDPDTDALVLDGFEAKPSRAVLLNDDRELRVTVDTVPWRWQRRPCVRLKGLPVEELTGEPMVVRMEFDPSVAQ